MKLNTIVIIVLSGSLFIVSVLFGIFINNNKKHNNKNLCTDINITNISNYTSNYEVFKNIDLLNKFDILDRFNDRINIYSVDLDSCFRICEDTNTCLGFIRFHNYCYLKNNSNIKDQTVSNDMNLFYRKNS